MTSERALAYPVDMSNEDSALPLPDWFDIEKAVVHPHGTPPMSQWPQLKREAQLQRFEIAFERGLDMMTDGSANRSLDVIVRENWPDVPFGRFMSWVKADPTRLQRYEDALEIVAEAISHELIRIADGYGPDGNAVLEDVDRSKLKFQARTKVMSYWNRRKFGESKTVEQNISVSHGDPSGATIEEMRTMLQQRIGMYDSAIESLRNAGFVFDGSTGELLGKEVNGVIVSLEKLS